MLLVPLIQHLVVVNDKYKKLHAPRDLSLCHLRSNFGLHRSVLGSNNHSRNWAKILLEHYSESTIHVITPIQMSVCPWHHIILKTKAFSFHCSSEWVSTSRLRIICCCCSAAAAVLSSINLGTSFLPLSCLWVPTVLTLSETCKVGQTFVLILRTSWKSR